MEHNIEDFRNTNMKSYAAIFFLVCVAFSFVSAEKGCPDAEEILPCTCLSRSISYYSPVKTYLTCKHIEDVEVLRNVFKNSARYRYTELHIEYSTLQYLPHDIFESVPVIEMLLVNVTLTTLFDSPPEALVELRRLYIENTSVLRGILWELLKPLKSLKILEIYSTSIRTIGKDFKKNAPKELHEVAFYETETKTIDAGVFDEFTQLDKLAVASGKLEELRRDMLPTPFNGSVLSFRENKISNIPDDMFSQMPNLRVLVLQSNQISTIPESAFEGTGSKLENLLLQGNPMKCDCRIQWLIRNKTPALWGTCESPKNLHGRELKDVSPSDINC